MKQIDYCIASIEAKYRGMERHITTESFYIEGLTKKTFETRLEEYFAYLEEDLNLPHDEVFFKRTLEYYARLKRYGINCEVIIYSNEPMESFNGWGIELLGIDIVHDFCESLLSNGVDSEADAILNENGLCKNKEDVGKIIAVQDPGDVDWSPIYVYRWCETQKPPV